MTAQNVVLARLSWGNIRYSPVLDGEYEASKWESYSLAGHLHGPDDDRRQLPSDYVHSCRMDLVHNAELRGVEGSDAEH